MTLPAKKRLLFIPLLKATMSGTKNRNAGLRLTSLKMRFPEGARGPRKLHVGFTATGLTHFGGLFLVQRFLQRLGVRPALHRSVRFPQRNDRYRISEMLVALLYPLVLGLGRIETTKPLRRNGVPQYLVGLTRYPEATSLRRFLNRFGSSVGLPRFARLHDRYRTALRAQAAPQTRAILDLDSTVLTVYGRQEKAAVGFNSKKRGHPSYLPLLCFDGTTRDAWAASFHLGNTQVASITLPLLAAWIAFSGSALPVSTMTFMAGSWASNSSRSRNPSLGPLGSGGSPRSRVTASNLSF